MSFPPSPTPADDPAWDLFRFEEERPANGAHHPGGAVRDQVVHHDDDEGSSGDLYEVSGEYIARALMEEYVSTGFATGEHDHVDAVRTVAYNFYGKRRVTGGADHRLKVHEKQEDGSWLLQDTWRAHDAEIFEAKWTSPYVGDIIGSIGNDGKFKLWEEDVAEPLNSGRRFKCIFTLHSQATAPFASFDFRSNNYEETYLAILTRSGLLSVYEANEPEKLTQWMFLDEFRICTPPVRGEEDGFKVQFDPNVVPCYTAVNAGLDATALSLVTSGADTVRVWRTDASKTFYQAAELSGHHGVIRDVTWADGSTRGYDMIATACKDGYIRIFELHSLSTSTDTQPPTISSIPTSTPHPPTNGVRPVSAIPETTLSRIIPPTPSGISAGLASSSISSSSRNPIASSSASGPDPTDRSRVLSQVREVAAISEHGHGTVWGLKWTKVAIQGVELMTTGDDAKLRVWKRDVEGNWRVFATVEAS
ncbi:MAG: epoxide hydrolase, soluble (sEH), partial [Thelocarpon superellum]